jgi:hypothetical protein
MNGRFLWMSCKNIFTLSNQNPLAFFFAENEKCKSIKCINFRLITGENLVQKLFADAKQGIFTPAEFQDSVQHT